MKKQEKNVFIIGSKGIPANYGGFESFVDKLTLYSNSSNIKYYVSCAVYNKDEYDKLDKEFTYHNAVCFRINVPNIGPGKAIVYDIKAFKYALKYIKKNNIKNPIVYVLACRIGPFIKHYKKRLRKLGGVLYVNPDGHEWLRAKWSAPVKKYWKISEQLMVKHADLLVCDNTYIEKYINSDYKKYNPKTIFIAYGSEISASNLKDDDEKVLSWYKEHNVTLGNYYLTVGRFVPENNFETMIREFMKSNSKKDLALITNVSSDFLEELKKKTSYDKDPRIKFVGTVYDQELLKYIRKHAYGYIHGHEVGGTNPSLLESLGITDLNLLLGVNFNREVGAKSALYWTKDDNSLANLIEVCDKLKKKEINQLGKLAKDRIKKHYSWEYITSRYESIFNNSEKYLNKKSTVR